MGHVSTWIGVGVLVMMSTALVLGIILGLSRVVVSITFRRRGWSDEREHKLREVQFPKAKPDRGHNVNAGNPEDPQTR